MNDNGHIRSQKVFGVVKRQKMSRRSPARVCPRCHLTPLPTGTICQHCLIAQLREDSEARVADVLRRHQREIDAILARIAEIHRSVERKSAEIMDTTKSQVDQLFQIQTTMANDCGTGPIAGTVTSLMTSMLKASRPMCPICYEDFEDGAEFVRLSCSHIFHRACLDAWMAKSTTCPECRRPIEVIV